MLLYTNQSSSFKRNCLSIIKILIFIKGLAHNLHTKFALLYEHMTWNRAKSFEVLGMGCSGLGGFIFTSVVPGDFVVHFPFKVLCLLIISFAAYIWLGK